MAGAQENLGNVLLKLGKFSEAEILHQQVLATKIEHYGTQAHMDVASTQENLGLVLQSLGQLPASETFLRQALKTKTQFYGTTTHIKVAEIQGNLGNTLEQLWQFAEAEIFLRQALETQIQFYGTEDDISVAKSQGGLANVLTGQMKFSEAEILYQKALKTKIRYYGTEMHTEVALTQLNLAKLYMQLGDFQKALLLIEQCESTFKMQVGGEQYLAACNLKKQIILSLQDQRTPVSSENEEALPGAEDIKLFPLDNNSYAKEIDYISSTLPYLLSQSTDAMLSNLPSISESIKISYAARKGLHKDLVLFLERHIELIDVVDINPKKGWTALHWAMQNNHYYCVVELLNRHSRYDIPDKTDQALTAVDICLKQNESKIKFFLFQYIFKNYLEKGVTQYSEALRVAANRNRLEDLKVFIANEIDIDSIDPDTGKTALHIASQKNHILIIKALIAAGANTQIQDYAGKYAIDYAKVNQQLLNLFLDEILEYAWKTTCYDSSVVQSQKILPSSLTNKIYTLFNHGYCFLLAENNRNELQIFTRAFPIAVHQNALLISAQQELSTLAVKHSKYFQVKQDDKKNSCLIKGSGFFIKKMRDELTSVSRKYEQEEGKIACAVS